MAKELPYYRFTVSEWLNDDISIETYEMKGVFIDVCAWYWFKDCSIDIATLKKRFRDATTIIDQLIEVGIIKVTDKDMIEISFLNKQFDILSEKRKKYVEAGRVGGLKRASNAKATLKQRSSYKDKDKDKDKDIILMSELSQKESSTVSEYEKIAIAFWKLTDETLRILEIDSKEIEKSKIESWVNPIRLAIEKDGRSKKDFVEVWQYMNTETPTKDGFTWRANIRSGAKLREKMSDVLIRSRSKRIGSRSGAEKAFDTMNIVNEMIENGE